MAEHVAEGRFAFEPAAASAVRTFLIADVRGYTRFTIEQGDEAAARLVAGVARLAEQVVSSHGGTVVEFRGDEVLAVFSSTRQALRAALELQDQFGQRREEWAAPVGLGIGLDAGEAIPVQGGYRGAALNLAARLCSMAGHGEVLASETVVNLARKSEGLEYAERGWDAVKGFPDPVHVFQVSHAHRDARRGELQDTGIKVGAAKIDAFRTRARGYLRRLGRTQKELARELGLHPNRLSHKLGGTDGAVLTRDEVKRMVETLAAWGAITTQAEAVELLELAGLRRETFTPAEWAEAPLRDLDPAPLGDLPPSSPSPASTPVARPTVLPIPPTSFVGRERDVAAIRELLGEAKLLTLTGTGGAGKTRLALQVATEVRGAFAEGVAFVPLAGVEDAGLVSALMAQELGLRQGARDVAALIGHLCDKQMLLVLDNFEHVLTAASVVEQLLTACPELTILVTSRIPLRLYGEHEYRVPPLGMARASSGAPAPAVQLFAQRARAARPSFSLSPETAPVVEQICAALDGLPLAIELAAARTKLFPPQVLLSHLTDRLSLLTGGARNLPQRQQTLRDALDWSHALLADEERGLFRHLAVFSGFDSETVQAICETGTDTLDRLVDLADQSLLEYVSDEAGVRFRMLQTVRDYAAARLAESGEAGLLRQRHAEYFLRLAEEAEPHLIGPDQMAWMRRLDREVENLRAALGQLLETAPGDALRLAIMLERYWGRRGYQAEGRYWLDEVLERTGVPRDPAALRMRATALVVDGVMTADLMEFDRADALLGEAMAIYESLGDRAGVAATLAAMGEPAYLRGDIEGSRAVREQALALYREVGDRWGAAEVQRALATIAMGQLEIERTSKLLDESTALFEELGDQWALAGLQALWAGLALFRGDHEGMFRLMREAIRMSQDLGDETQAAQALLGVALAFGELGDTRRAARVWGAGEKALWRSGVGRAAVLSIPAAAPMRAIVEDPEYAGELEAGRALSIDEAIALAFTEGPAAP